ncbi:MAG: UDP-glucose/GDP-mannose dehydrogenase family protein [Polyangiaceae bacterium]|nr:UDP-glucose/GDP-mannose dehydrogenase family protein [Polyangiaceae bacterium]
MHVGIIGTGYVGLVAGAGFADFGNDVICADVDQSKIDRLNRGEVPIYEPGLDDLIERNAKAGRLKFTTNVEETIRAADIVFIAVGTPPAADGSADLTAVYKVAETFGKVIDRYKVIVDKSTVPVGTADKVREIVAAQTKVPFAVASNPEFLKEGAAINDFMKPDRVVIGSDDERAREMLKQLYAPFVRTADRIHVMDPRSAELTKYAANAMLATRISFMNDLAVLAEKIGADIESVRKGVGTDTRIGPKFLYAGPGYGGSCFPKDLSALVFLADKVGHGLEVVRAAENVNKRQKRVLPDKIKAHFGGDLKGRVVGVWGLAFKPETDDIRESPALVLIDEILAAGATVKAHDPEAMTNVRAIYGDKVTLTDAPYDVADGADALALVTEWHAFRAPDFERLRRIMRTPALFDGRNIWPKEELARLGFSYQGIGRRPAGPVPHNT